MPVTPRSTNRRRVPRRLPRTRRAVSRTPRDRFPAGLIHGALPRGGHGGGRRQFRRINRLISAFRSGNWECRKSLVEIQPISVLQKQSMGCSLQICCRFAAESLDTLQRPTMGCDASARDPAPQRRRACKRRRDEAIATGATQDRPACEGRADMHHVARPPYRAHPAFPESEMMAAVSPLAPERFPRAGADRRRASRRLCRRHPL